jgi:2OG-Fe(II) oxygenase superfamily
VNKNLDYYVKVYDNWIDPEICKKTINEFETQEYTNTFQQHLFYDIRTKTALNRSGENELEVSCSNVSSKDYLMKKVWDGCYQYLTDLDFSWFNNWSGYSDIRFNKYSENKCMAIHCDHIQSLFDGEKKGIPTLSIVGLLNDDYDGGEFVMWTDQVIKLKCGSVMIFPSNFLFPHRVNPVKKGTRYSFVSWAY